MKPGGPDAPTGPLTIRRRHPHSFPEHAARLNAAWVPASPPHCICLVRHSANDGPEEMGAFPPVGPHSSPLHPGCGSDGDGAPSTKHSAPPRSQSKTWAGATVASGARGSHPCELRWTCTSHVTHRENLRPRYATDTTRSSCSTWYPSYNCALGPSWPSWTGCWRMMCSSSRSRPTWPDAPTTVVQVVLRLLVVEHAYSCNYEETQQFIHDNC